MGRFSVELEVANNDDLALGAAEVCCRRISFAGKRSRAWSIPGRQGCVLPEDVVKRLGLPLVNTFTVRYADGRQAKRKGAEGVYVQLLGRHGTFQAIVEPWKSCAGRRHCARRPRSAGGLHQPAAGSPRSEGRNLRHRVVNGRRETWARRANPPKRRISESINPFTVFVITDLRRQQSRFSHSR